MENTFIEVTQQQIETALKFHFTKALTDSYDSPIRKAVESAIREKEGVIKKAVDDIIVEAISNPEFKTRIADIVITKMVEVAIKK